MHPAKKCTSIYVKDNIYTLSSTTRRRQAGLMTQIFKNKDINLSFHCTCIFFLLKCRKCEMSHLCLHLKQLILYMLHV